MYLWNTLIFECLHVKKNVVEKKYRVKEIHYTNDKTILNYQWEIIILVILLY